MNTNLNSEILDVAIVGAGPTGLALAAALTQRKVGVAVFDRQSAGANTSRAAVVHAHTLEALESIGVATELTRRGLRAQRFTIRDRDRTLVQVPFGHLPTQYPFTLMVSQAETEKVLRDRLGQLGGEVRWNCGVSRVDAEADFARVTLDDGSEIRARYVVGADGMHSKVREFAGIGFDGGSYGESFVLADVRLGGDVPCDEVILYFSPEGLVVVAPLPDGVHRIVATLDSAPATPTVADVQALLDARGPERGRFTVGEVIWGSRFRVHHRLAQKYVNGRIVLAGDAAHVHSPAGGQGMNTGILDGLRLAEALEAALRGDASALVRYESERRPVAKGVIALAHRLTRLATAPRLWRPLRNALLGLLGRLPPFQRNLAWNLSGLVNRRSGGEGATDAGSEGQAAAVGLVGATLDTRPRLVR
jgi:2-polyprenyl-6-methoxyphenol hydroxylase-like FAD-dependent oxidoreductase